MSALTSLGTLFPPSSTHGESHAVVAMRTPFDDVITPNGPLVLVVDDHADSRTVARLVLESADFRVAEAENGTEGLQLATALHPCAVLLDLVLPAIDGWELARRLRCDDVTRDVIIIAVTALALPDARDRAHRAGCNAVLVKPAPPSLILETVRRLVGMPVAASPAHC